MGHIGEEHASQHLARRGFVILERNWRSGHLEVDIIAQKDGITHIVEVKTRHENTPVAVHELLTYPKQQALLRAANRYAELNRNVRGVQIDLVLVLVGPGGLSIEYFEDAVVPHF
ncbi:MAG: endonuclease [Bacteroidia bacterium]|nr:MAG: endonuclease [Bacteroidia bacterium]